MSHNTSTSTTLIISRCLIGFAALSLVTSLFVSLLGNDRLLNRNVDGTGGTLGPFTLEEANTVLHAEVHQNLPLGDWSFVTLELLDASRNYLTGFGDEFWHESGYDSDGYWEQAESNYTAKVTVPDAGDYYLKVQPESSLSDSKLQRSDINIQLETRGFSTVPHFAAGLIALIVGLVLNFIGGGISYQMLNES